MRVDAFDFELPEANIALRPAEPRDAARMLLVDGETTAFTDGSVADLPSLLRPGDALVFNDTKVLPAQLHGQRVRGEAIAGIAATMHMRTAPDRWRAFVRGARRLTVGDTVSFSDAGDFDAEVLSRDGAEVEFRFDCAGPALDEAFRTHGAIPLPPYIAGKRPTDERDSTDYQTVYANEAGAVAAPTAGLHFTPDLMDRLDARGIERLFVTLHVGAGTFLPVSVDETTDHVMHAEIGTLDAETAERLNAVRAGGGRIVCVGTTSLRLLESAVDTAGRFEPWRGATDIFITPGYRFRAADGLMTNFHLPRSTLFMLVSAFSGLERMQAAYAHAIGAGYRFYSYGDSSLLWPMREAKPR